MKSVLVTGASTGIGFSTAVYLSERGFKVYAGVRKPEHEQSLLAASKGAITPILLDVTDTNQILAAIEKIKNAGAGLWGLVNNAGIVVAGPLEYLSVEELKEQFEVNVFGLHNMTIHALPLLRESRGRVVHVGSVSGHFAFPFVGPYCASKFAVTALGDSLRRELRPHGIKVSLIEPGRVITPIWEKSAATNNARRARLPKAAEAHYGESMTKLEVFTQKAAHSGVASEVVAKKIHHALSSRCPRAHYLVGADARIEVFLQRFIPARWADWLVSKMF